MGNKTKRINPGRILVTDEIKADHFDPEPEPPTIKSLVNKRYRVLPLVSDFLPLTLDNGAAVKDMVARCSSCEKQILQGMFRGSVNSTVDGAFRVTGIGWCVECDTMSHFLFHVIKKDEKAFELRPLETRGWPEAFTPKVLPFAPVKKKKRRTQDAQNTA